MQVDVHPYSCLPTPRMQVDGHPYGKAAIAQSTLARLKMHTSIFADVRNKTRVPKFSCAQTLAGAADAEVAAEAARTVEATLLTLQVRLCVCVSALECVWVMCRTVRVCVCVHVVCSSVRVRPRDTRHTPPLNQRVR